MSLDTLLEKHVFRDDHGNLIEVKLTRSSNKRYDFTLTLNGARIQPSAIASKKSAYLVWDGFKNLLNKEKENG